MAYDIIPKYKVTGQYNPVSHRIHGTIVYLPKWMVDSYGV